MSRYFIIVFFSILWYSLNLNVFSVSNWQQTGSLHKFLFRNSKKNVFNLGIRHQNVFWFWFINWKPRIKIYWLTLLLLPRFLLVVKSSIFSVVNRPTDKCKIHDSYIFLTAPIDQSGRASIIPSSPDSPGPGSLRTQNYQTGPGVPAAQLYRTPFWCLEAHFPIVKAVIFEGGIRLLNFNLKFVFWFVHVNSRRLNITSVSCPVLTPPSSLSSSTLIQWDTL